MEVQKPQSEFLDALTDSAKDVRAMEKEKKSRGTKRDRVILAVLAALNAAVFFAIGVTLWVGQRAQKKIDREIEERGRKPYYSVEHVLSLRPTLPGVKYPAGISEDFMRLYAVNEDVKGWLRIEGTCIDYPVLRGEDNVEYERIDYYRRPDDRGSVWLDVTNEVGPDTGPLSKVSIIWGHHFSEHELAFYEVEKYYDDLQFYKDHPLIEFTTIYGNTYRWKIVGAFLSAVEPEDDNGKVFYYWNTYLSDTDIPGFASEIRTRSSFWNPDVDIVPSDRFLLLSTCTYRCDVGREYHDIRCVLAARLVRDGEDPAVDVERAYVNDHPRMPHLWYLQHNQADPFITTPVFGW